MSARALPACLRLAPSVRVALANGEPVVALESTIISHGMPYPQNIDTARAVEAEVAAHGATPATVALVDGRMHVGLGDAELERLARAGGGGGAAAVVKASRRDLAAVLSRGQLGATTVSGTMVAAHLAGIRVFATGGIGGVHRGAERTLDVSADLAELARTPVAVVCAGAKAILDLPKTLEYLETCGVPVIAYRNGGEFPAFYTARSGLRAPWAMDTPGEVASLLKTSADLGLCSGAVVAVPIPAEHAPESAAEIERAVAAAVAEAEARGIAGKECTPFLLRRVSELTRGASLAANVALVKNNARVASLIAGSLAGMARRRQYSTTTLAKRRPVLVVGGTAVDITSRVAVDPGAAAAGTSGGAALAAATSYPGTVGVSVGGVGQNIARAARLLGADVALASAVGADAHGQLAASELEAAGVDTRFLQRPRGAHTAVYSALHGPDGDLVAAVADMEINALVSAPRAAAAVDALGPCVVALDANIPRPVIAAVLARARAHGACVVFEPTSVPKCTAVLHALRDAGGSGGSGGGALVHVATPNRLELRRLAEAALELGLAKEQSKRKQQQDCTLDPGVVGDALALFPVFPVLVVKLGARGVAVVSPAPEDRSRPVLRHIPPLRPARVVNSSGAGDSLVGAVLAMLHRRQQQQQQQLITGCGHHLDLTPCDIAAIVQRAQRAAVAALESPSTISPSLGPELIDSD